MYVYEVPNGETLKIWTGTTARQRVAKDIDEFYLPGGDQQIFIPDDIRDDFFKDVVDEVNLPW